MLYTKSAFAKLCGKSPGTITKAAKEGKALHSALTDGGKIDGTVDAAIEYLEKSGGTIPADLKIAIDNKNHKPNGWRGANKAKKEAAVGAGVPDLYKGKELDAMMETIPEDIRKFANMSLKRLVAKFGTDVRFMDWLKASKAIEDVEEKRIKNGVARGELIPRKFVEQHLFGAIETSNMRLINDSPRTIAARTIDAIESGMTKEEIEEMIRGLISDQLVAVKGKAQRALKNV